MTRPITDHLQYLVARLFIRAFRMLCGVGIVVLALLAGMWSWDLLSTPFVQSSFISLLGGILLAGVTFFLFIGGFLAAFGDGPSEEEWISQSDAQTKADHDAYELERNRQLAINRGKEPWYLRKW